VIWAKCHLITEVHEKIQKEEENCKKHERKVSKMREGRKKFNKSERGERA
jgi:hypothetical protein